MNKICFSRAVGFLILLLAIQIVAKAQTGNVSGTVTGASRKSALPGVSVRVEGQGIQTVTDESGRCLLQGVRAGR
jgi:hypothetical protein